MSPVKQYFYRALLPLGGALLVLAACFFTETASGALDPRLVSSSGTTRNANQRKIVATADGYWVFFTQGAYTTGTPVYTFSATGNAGSWSTPAEIFPGLSDLNGQPSVWYEADQNRVYVAVGQSSNASGGARKIYVTKGDLVAGGVITWSENGHYDDGNCNAAGQFDLSGDFPVAIAVDITTYVWISANGADHPADTPANDLDDQTVYARSTNADSVATWPATRQAMDNNACNATVADRMDGAINTIVPRSTVGEVWMTGHFANGNTEGEFAHFNENDNAPNTAETPNLQYANSYGGYGEDATTQDYQGTRNVSTVVDSAGNQHLVWISSNAPAAIFYSRITPNDVSAAVAHTTAPVTGPFKMVSIGVAKSSGTAGAALDRLFVFFVEDATGDDNLYYIEGSTSISAASGWSGRTFVTDNASYPNAAYSVTIPDPLPYVYGNSGVKFDWVVTTQGRYAAPNITNISTSPTTAPFSTKSYDYVFTGTGFVDWGGTKKSTIKILKNGGTQTEISVTSTTVTSATSIKASVVLVPTVSGGPYTVVVTNPDGQFQVLTNTITIPAPTFTNVTDPDADGYVSGAGFTDNSDTTNIYRNLTIRGTNFMNWSSTEALKVYVDNPAGTAISNITASTYTFLSYGAGVSSVTVGLKISTGNTNGGPYQIRIVNPTNQSAVLASPNTFYLTIATATVSYPLSGNTTGFTSMSGGMSFMPVAGQASSSNSSTRATQLKITRTYDGAIWDPTFGASGGFQPSIFFTPETAYFALSSSSPWTFSWTPTDADYTIVARGRTSDQPKTSAGADTGVGGPDSTAVSILVDNTAPDVDITAPPRASGANAAAASPLRLSINDALGYGSSGTGIKKIQYLIMTNTPVTDPVASGYLTGTATNTWVSWNTITSGWGAAGVIIWNSTGPSPANPALEFTTKKLSASIQISSNTGDVRIPAWTDGKEYFISAISTDAMNQIGTSETSGTLGVITDAYPQSNSGFRFIFDITIPTVTASATITAISTISGSPSWLASLTSIDGTIADNVASTVDPRKINLRVYENQTGKYLNPATLIKFETSDANSAWAEIQTPLNSWSYDTSATKWVSGNTYKMEIYATDGAGNQDPSPATCAPNCKTGSSAYPKYTQYFTYDKIKPDVVISSPITTNPNFVGGLVNLATISGTTGDTVGQISKVEFALQYNRSDPTYHWEHYLTSGTWKNPYSGDIWNTAYNPNGNWSVWTSSNITWVESQDYILKVRATDKAGNVSNEIQTTPGNYVTFTFDNAAPISTVTSITPNFEYTTQVLSIAGTAIDQTSTGTASGLSTHFFAGVKRQSDNYWWNGTTWTVTRNDPDIGIAGGLGSMAWTLSLNTTFYDLLKVSVETFTVYSWGHDRVNNPTTNYANIESSQTAKVSFQFRSGAPIAFVDWPAQSTVQKSVSSTTLNVSAVGTGISQIWSVFVDTNNFYWTGSSWSTNGGYDPSTNNYIWLSTDTAGGGTPDMIFVPPLSQSNILATFTNATTLKSPTWADGRQYSIYVKAQNSAGQQTNSYPGSYRFIYDVTVPTVTLASGTPDLLNLSTTAASPTWVTSMLQINGTMDDNVSDGLNSFYIYVRVYSQQEGKYLNPNTLTFIEPDLNAAWKQIQVTGTGLSRSWSFDTSAVSWQPGFDYKIEVYARDSAGNLNGSAGSPKYVKYFLFDNNAPTLAIKFPGNNNNYGLNSLPTISGTSNDGTSGITRIEWRLEHPPLSKWEHFVTSGVWRNGSSNTYWNLAKSTVPTAYSIWFSTNISWIDGEQYTFIARAYDLAGNVSASYSTSTFKYDVSAPTASVVRPAFGNTYSQSLLTISGTIADLPDTTGGRNAGLELLKIGVKRVSDSKWWDGSTWTVTRDDVAHAAPAGGTWQHQAIGNSFWSYFGPGAAETFEIYVWGQDLVDKPDASYKNIASSMTLGGKFLYETQAPSSTIVTPIHNQWYSAVSPYNLAIISGTSFDRPSSGPGSGGSVSKVEIQVRRGNDDNKCWNGATAFNENCLTDASWVLTTNNPPASNTYEYDPTGSGLWNATEDGVAYRVQFRGYDTAKAADDSSRPNVEGLPPNPSFNVGQNSIIFKVDKGAPTAIIQKPNTNLIFGLSPLSGTAADANVSVLKVEVAFYGVSEGNWWNPATVGTFNLGGSNSAPPSNAFVMASTDTSSPVNWWVNLSSTPALVDNSTYRIFVRVTDTTGNQNAFPGHASVTTPPTQSTFITVQKVVPTPESTLVIPAAGLPYYKPGGLTTVTGNFTDGTTVQVRLTNTTADPDEVWAGSLGWQSTTTYLANCTNSTYVVGKSTCGFQGISAITGGTQWQYNVTGIWPSGTKRFLAEVRAASESGPTVESEPFDSRSFVIDGDNPSLVLTEPNAAYEKGLPIITGNASDVGLGLVSNVEIAISTGGQLQYWNGSAWVGSVQWLTTTPETSFDLNSVNWSRNTGLPPAVNGLTYELQARVTEKTSQTYLFPQPGPTFDFIIDFSSPTSRFIRPRDTNALNNLPTISGTAADNQVNSMVQVAILKNDGSGTSWWNHDLSPADFDTSAQPIWNLVTSTVGYLSPNATSWFYAPAGMNTKMASGFTYTILTRAIDVAGNVQSAFTQDISSITITMDKTPPSSTITMPADSGTPGAGRYTPNTIGWDATASGGSDTRIAGNKSDTGVGIKEIRMRLSYLLSGDTYYWTGTNFSSYTVTANTAWLLTNKNVWRYSTDILPGSWTPILDVNGHRQFLVESRAEDDTLTWDGVTSGNLQSPVAQATFIVDNSPPTLGITGPVATAMNTLTTITGTADAILADFNRAEVKISTGGSFYWTAGSSWTSNVTWISTSRDGSGGWHYNVPVAMLADATYTVVARALDYAGQYSTALATKTFTVDRTTPTVSITVPQNNGFYSLVSPVVPMSGSSADSGTQATNISTVAIAIADVSSGTYFNGTVFAGGSPVWHGVDNDGSLPNWNFTPPALTLHNDRKYRVQARSQDAAGNFSLIATSTFTYDVTNPTVGSSRVDLQACKLEYSIVSPK